LDFKERIRREFLERIPIIFKGIRQIGREFVEAADSDAEAGKLEELTRKIGFLTQMTGSAGYHRLAELCSALEAMLFELREKPALINDSCRNTIASTVAFLDDSLDRVELVDDRDLTSSAILVVDDDAVSNKAFVFTLARARLSATSVTDPTVALARLQQTAYDLLLLDINMPEMDGLALCEQIRSLPLHRRTPVIFVTSLTDFKTRARAILSGGNDLITKPILPVELCVKVITHLLKAGQPAPKQAKTEDSRLHF
jgi:CheY-like chemotaxis protein